MLGSMHDGVKTIAFGDAGNDILVGSKYDDVFEGGTGDDDMPGGGGNDKYVFSGTPTLAPTRSSTKPRTSTPIRSISRTWGPAPMSTWRPSLTPTRPIRSTPSIPPSSA